MDEFTPIEDMTDEDIRIELSDHGVTLHHKTGSQKLAETLAKVREGDYKEEPVQVATPVAPEPIKYTEPTPTAKKAAADSKVLTKQQRALRMQRIMVVPNDPLMSKYNGLIFTVGSSSVNNGRMVKKYVPFNNEEGWHVPQIIIDQIEAAKMQKFKETTLPNGQKTMTPYMAKKFNVHYMDALTKVEMETLAAAQKARGSFQ